MFLNPNPDAWRDSYDEWKLRSPYDDWDEESEFYCEECEDTAFIAPDELCPACQEPVTLFDLEDIAEASDGFAKLYREAR